MPKKQSRIFSGASEKEVTRAIVREFAREFDEYAESDALIVGAGPSGLMCAKVLAERGVKVLIVERNNYLGGGFWVGGYLMNKVVLRSPTEKNLASLGVPYKETSPGLFVADGPHACSKLIAAALDAGAKVLNMTTVDDVVLREKNRVAGLVINWTSVKMLPRQISCLDPVAIEAKVVVDATGHDAAVAQLLADRGLLKVPGCNPMWINESEDEVVLKTGFVHPGLLAIGMSVSSIHAVPRMGPSFGAMLMSGERGAVLVLKSLGRYATLASSRGRAWMSEVSDLSDRSDGPDRDTPPPPRRGRRPALFDNLAQRGIVALRGWQLETGGRALRRDVLQIVFVVVVIAVGVGYAKLYRDTAFLQTRLQAMYDRVENFDRRLQARQSDEEMVRALMTRIGHFTQLCQGQVTEATRRLVGAALTERQGQPLAAGGLPGQLIDMLKPRDLEEFAGLAGLDAGRKQALAEAAQQFNSDILAALGGMENASAEACRPVFEAASKKRLDVARKTLSRGQFNLFCLYYNVAPPPPEPPAAPKAAPAPETQKKAAAD